jgi:hypothetical protein
MVRLNQVGYAVGDHPRLAAARSGQQQQWPLHVGNRFTLLRVETFQKIHL